MVAQFRRALDRRVDPISRRTRTPEFRARRASLLLVPRRARGPSQC